MPFSTSGPRRRKPETVALLTRRSSRRRLYGEDDHIAAFIRLEPADLLLFFAGIRFTLDGARTKNPVRQAPVAKVTHDTPEKKEPQARHRNLRA